MSNIQEELMASLQEVQEKTSKNINLSQRDFEILLLSALIEEEA